MNGRVQRNPTKNYGGLHYSKQMAETFDSQYPYAFPIRE
jgi:hypothetical protein